MDNLPNGFTGFSAANRPPDFESAGEASRRTRGEYSERAANAKWGIAPDRLAGAHAAERAIPDAGDEDDADEGAFSPEEARGAHAGQDVSGNQDADSDPASGLEGGSASEARSALTPVPFDAHELEGIDLPGSRWAWAQVNLAAVRHNVAQMRRFLQPRCRFMAVVKADAYGHGAVEVSKAALGAGADWLAVSNVAEAMELRNAGINAPILILSQPPASTIALLLAYDLMPSVYTPEFAIAYAEAADLHGMKAPYHLAVNSGMNRIGVKYDRVVEFLYQVSFHRALELAGVYTQFATAECPESLDFQIQANRFVDAVDAICAAGFDPGIVHGANTAAALRYPGVQFDMARVGGAMYGLHPCEDTRDLVELRPVLSVHARITDVRVLGVSEGVSYGLRYRSPGSVKICTIPIGYADGLQRNLSGAIDFIYDGRYLRQVGDICMDQCMFEVDLRRTAKRVPADPHIGDEVIVVGSQGIAQVTIDEMAEKLGTVNYEVAIGFLHRLPRIYT